MKLNIITALTRPFNLPQIAESFIGASAADIDIVWYILPDLHQQAVGGQRIKNKALDAIESGWVWICDDDNCAHERFWPVLANQTARLIYFPQIMPVGHVREARLSDLRETFVDAAQVVIDRELIGKKRLPDRYTGDGAWIEEIAKSMQPSEIQIIAEPATYYNRLAQ